MSITRMSSRAEFETGAGSLNDARACDGTYSVSNARMHPVVPVLDQRQSLASLIGRLADTAPAQVDVDWKKCVTGLKQLNPQTGRRFRMLWPANDGGRPKIVDVKSTLPLHILTGAVAVFAVALIAAGAISLATHPEWAPWVAPIVTAFL